jgi:hypothetical protein
MVGNFDVKSPDDSFLLLAEKCYVLLSFVFDKIKESNLIVEIEKRLGNYYYFIIFFLGRRE